MAGMFYSLQEAAEKLNRREEELKQWVTEGKLREFRDGPNLLFKVEEVEGLMSDADSLGLQEIPEVEAPEPEVPILEALEPEAPEAETPTEETLEPDVVESEVPELEALEPDVPELEIPEAEFGASDVVEPEVPTGSEDAGDTDEILLAPETGAPVVPSDLTDADTALTGLGTSVLGETDQDYDITDDTMAETAVPTGTTPEVPLEEIEEDVNLDSFGSGSGLLDLSLQADDTSLGGILDEIYTAEGEGKEPGEAGGDSAAVAAEAEHMVSEDELVAPQPALGISALAAPLIEAAPDAQSSTLGMLLFLPLAVVIYTTVVAVAGLQGVMPSILATVQSFIWYIMGGAAVLTGLVVAAAFLFTGERGTATKREKKPKKAKKPKEPKAAKKEKKAKEPKKPKKAKKG